MSNINKTYRIKTEVGKNLQNDFLTLDVNLLQDYDSFDILSVKIDNIDTYHLHNSNYGVVVGRVIANNGFGVPNAKLSIFIESEDIDDERIKEIYSFNSALSKDKNGVRYNLLPDNKVGDCHQIVGTFPNKRYLLDNDVIIEVFDKYYKYTTVTNNSGDYLIMGVPVGTHTLHMDLDLSDCGILSQKPRDFVYKGYTIEQFENPNKFKNGTEYANLSQVFSQNQTVNIQPFWGNSDLGEKIGITRADIDVNFRFEPTCVFLGSVISDNSSQGISKKCIPTDDMGNMEDLVTGEGTIEMIRKTPGGSVEEFQIKGTQLINGDGIWCYQIPMNLDYMMTDEYGNMVPTDDPNKGIPTRTRVRFRVSMQDNEENVDNFFRAKVLVPHNPQNLPNGEHEDYDYEFGTYTKEESYRDLFWNNVYSVKSYIPRFQKQTTNVKTKRFTGIKSCNYYGQNNPIPYNNMRVRLPFNFQIMCALIKVFIFVVGILNTVISLIGNFMAWLGRLTFMTKANRKQLYGYALDLSLTVIKDGLCPDLDNWYFAPMFKNTLFVPDKNPPEGLEKYDLLKQTLNRLNESNADSDITSIDYQNNQEMNDNGVEPMCITIHTDYLISCVELNLALENRVINFDFYNDWINGTIYIPRFMRDVKTKHTVNGGTLYKTKIKGCMDDTSIFSRNRRYTQQCALGYKPSLVGDRNVYTNITNLALKKNGKKIANNLHKKNGMTQQKIFGKNGGICHTKTTLKGQYVYYMKPCEWTIDTTPSARKVNLYATDIILLGSLNDCDMNGLPQAFKYLSSTSYIMPTNLALTNMESDSYIYTTENGVLCSGNNMLSEDDVKNGSKVKRIESNEGLEGEFKALSGSSYFNASEDIDELSDVIALTEAAGVAWNYTGPGQGKIDESKFYYPGGHFLGLSCVNSQVNAKSCINLSRICEMGVNMSQRKEQITSVDSSGNVAYTYTVPSGFISGNDIVGSEFRTMFATMNYKRLLATKINPLTGYKMYDFNYLKPINFDGTFKSITRDNELYNGKIEDIKIDEDFWKSMGVTLEEDDLELVNSQTRTIEDTSIDYYLYRFGLTYEDLKNNNINHLRKFLKNNGNELFLPQYENSYYFYFGLRNGATALDEFNKQFFAECENGKIEIGVPSISITPKEELNMCEQTVDILISTENIEAPYKSITIKCDDEVVEIKNYEEVLNSYYFTLENGKFGDYTVTIVDNNGEVYTNNATIGKDLVTFNAFEVYDFNCVNKDNNDELLFRGGYINISNVNIKGLDDNLDLTIIVNNTDKIPPKFISSAFTKNGAIDDICIPVNEAGNHELIIKYNCGDDEKYFKVRDFIVKDNSSLKLMLGERGYMSEEMTIEKYNPKSNWWTSSNMADDNHWLHRVSTFNEINPINKGNETTKIKTYAVNGTKVVWGMPQNKRGIYSDNVYNTEDITKVPAGYILDDEVVYYSTYPYMISDAKKQFSALVYNGETVMGNYETYLKDGVIKSPESKYLSRGYGYIFKPLPSGDLQFHVYNNEYTYNDKTETGEEIKNGLFYPSVAYPSIERPFYAQTNFYIWQNMLLDYNEYNQIDVINKEEAGLTEMKIYNGVTYDGKFGNTTIQPYVTNIEDFIFKPDENDIKGLNDLNSKSRIYYIEEFNKNIVVSGGCIVSGEEDISNYGYEITEGMPQLREDIYVNFVNTITDNIQSDFSEYVTYYEFNDVYYSLNDEINSKNGIFVNIKGTKNLIDNLPKTGNYLGDAYYVKDEDNALYVWSENEWKRNSEYYYLCASYEDESELVTSSNTRYFYSYKGREYYTLCTYTSNATETNIKNKEGLFVILKIEFDSDNRNGGTYYYNMYNEEGVLETITSNFTIETGGADYQRMERIVSKIAALELVKKYDLKYQNGDWSSYLKPISGNSENITNIFAVAVKENINTQTKLYKIFPNTIKISKPDIKFMQASESSVEFALTGGTKEVSIRVANNLYGTEWECTVDRGLFGDALRIYVENNGTFKEVTDLTFEGKGYTILKIETDSIIIPRNANLNFKIKNNPQDEGTVIKIIQKRQS